MEKEIICIVCPNGCRLLASEDLQHQVSVTGNKCKKGLEFARNELTNPTRTLTTTVRTAFEDLPFLPVRTRGEIPKEKMEQVIKELAKIRVEKRASMGDIIVKNIAETNIDIIASMDM